MLPLLTECNELITSIEKGIIESTPQNLDRIRCLINSCGVHCQKRIWKYLYFHYAQNATEDRWSEKHFHEHLPGLRVKVQEMIGDLHKFQEMNSLPSWFDDIL